jgi:RYK receptor-like tyrosine kinase
MKLYIKLLSLSSTDNGYGGMSQVVVVDSPPAEINSAGIFYIAVGCACALITVIVIVVTAYYVRNNKARRQGEMLQ